MIRITVTDPQRAEIRTRAHAAEITPRLRDRLEMIRLADAGWSVPRIAHHLACHEQTVRKDVRAFLTDGLDALPYRPRPGRPPTVTAAHLDAVATLLDAGGRTWTTPQLVTWLEREQGVRVHPDHLSHLLHARGFGWKRTVPRSPIGSGIPSPRPRRWTSLPRLKKGNRRADRSLVSRPERLRADVADRLHLGRRGQRLEVPYEASQGRRVNVVGALAPFDPGGAQLRFASRRRPDGPYDATAHLAFVRQLVPATSRHRPCVVVLDNYSVHHSHTVTDALPELAAAGITFCFLPPYSPKLNPIEAVWRQIKYQDLPERSYPTDTALQTAVDAALIARAAHLYKSTKDLPRPAYLTSCSDRSLSSAACSDRSLSSAACSPRRTSLWGSFFYVFISFVLLATCRTRERDGGPLLQHHSAAR